MTRDRQGSGAVVQRDETTNITRPPLAIHEEAFHLKLGAPGASPSPQQEDKGWHA